MTTDPADMGDGPAIAAGLECWRDTAPLSEAEQAFITKILAHLASLEAENKALRGVKAAARTVVDVWEGDCGTDHSIRTLAHALSAFEASDTLTVTESAPAEGGDGGRGR